MPDAEKTAIAAADKVGYPVVVKQMSGRKGLGISVDVKGRQVYGELSQRR